MNWKQEAVDKLKRLSHMDTACRTIPMELQRLRAERFRLKSSLSSVGVATSGSRREDHLLNNLVLRQELQTTLARSRQWLQVVNLALQQLTRQERQLLERLYIHTEQGGVERLCKELDIEKSTLYRRRDQALLNFTRLLYGCGADEKE